ncbi:MAG: hypothetical protein QY306_17970 [Anaerolineales bacterium]|nr:MAG: hypothetical protein QY306_17970 [Anaerolineales bacterium]
MSNFSDLKPWFREDIARILVSIYFASAASSSQSSINEAFRNGFATALSSVALNIGINPESFLAQEDITLIRKGFTET